MPGCIGHSQKARRSSAGVSGAGGEGSWKVVEQVCPLSCRDAETSARGVAELLRCNAALTQA